MKDRYAQLDMATQKARAARRVYPFRPPAELGISDIAHVPVAIAGGGPVGLALAVALAGHEIRSVVLERDNTLSDGSRAICWSKRTLEICDRLGVAERMCAKGVTWNVGKVFCGDDPEPLYSFDLLPDKEQKFPAFINLQQFYTEEYLVDRLGACDGAELRWQHEVLAVAPQADGVEIGIGTPAGAYRLHCDYLIAADGCRSPIRGLLGLDFAGRSFEDNFLIADVRMRAPFPAERRFYFNAPFNGGRTALMHQQPDGIWRLDFQLGWNIDRTDALREENVSAKVRAMLGPDVDFDYEWVSIYTFQCRRMERFVHDRVIFIGDAAHLVSPFGARGANGGLQDVDNLAWKLAAVLRAEAPRRLLDSYDAERAIGADENILNSTRSTDFMTPKTALDTAWRDAVLELARDCPFARAFVNSGRLSVPCSLEASELTTPDCAAFGGSLRPGEACLDAPITVDGEPDWFMNQLGSRFVCVHFARGAGTRQRFPDPDALPPGLDFVIVGAGAEPVPGRRIEDPHAWLRRRYDGLPGTTYLIRPDQHVAARWREPELPRIAAAWARAAARG